MSIRPLRLPRSVLKITVIAITAVIVTIVIHIILTIETNIMASDQKLEMLDKNTTILSVISILAVLVTFFTSVFILRNNNESTRIRDERSEVLKKSQDEANIKIAELNKEIASANENAAKSRERATVAELRSKELELELEKLKLSVADRFIPDNIYKASLVKLSKYKNKKVIVKIMNNDNSIEPINFAKYLAYMFDKSGWRVDLTNSGSMIYNNEAPKGFTIGASGDTNLTIAKFIHEQFRVLDYKVTFQKIHDIPCDLFIQVWTK